MLVVYEQPLETTSWAEGLVRKYAVDCHIYNMVTLFWLNDSTVHKFTYSPFEERAIRLPDDAFSFQELFSDKASDFQQKPLKVSLFPEEVRAVKQGNVIVSGPDFDMAKLLANKLNATLQLFLPPDTEEYGNPTSPNNASGSLGQVVREEVDMSLNSRFLRLDLFQNNNIAEPTKSIGRDDMCVLVCAVLS